MDTRIALEKNTVLKSKDSGLSYTILDEIARGGSCIVYDAVYTTASGVKKPVRLKECYPFHLNIKRTESGRLLPDEEETLCFEQYGVYPVRLFRRPDVVRGHIFQFKRLCQHCKNGVIGGAEDP